jgi:hypothetical protein
MPLLIWKMLYLHHHPSQPHAPTPAVVHLATIANCACARAQTWASCRPAAPTPRVPRGRWCCSGRRLLGQRQLRTRAARVALARCDTQRIRGRRVSTCKLLAVRSWDSSWGSRESDERRWSAWHGARLSPCPSQWLMTRVCLPCGIAAVHDGACARPHL